MLGLFKKRLRELGHGAPRNGMYRTKADCLHVCEAGPTLVIYPKETWYHSMTVEKLGANYYRIFNRL